MISPYLNHDSRVRSRREVVIKFTQIAGHISWNSAMAVLWCWKKHGNMKPHSSQDRFYESGLLKKNCFSGTHLHFFRFIKQKRIQYLEFRLWATSTVWLPIKNCFFSYVPNGFVLKMEDRHIWSYKNHIWPSRTSFMVPSGNLTVCYWKWP